MIDLHSYSDDLVQKIFGWTGDFPDVCIGYDQKWFSERFALELKKYIENLGYSCKLNYPYSGALVPADFYHNKTYNIQSVMLEINRRVYLREDVVCEEAMSNINKIIDFINQLTIDTK